jgi:RNA polymerase sigma-70 factor (ECF subfamily)
LQPTTGAVGHEKDRALAEAVARKDRKAASEFVQLYADVLFGYVMARVRPHTADAEDLTQEIFLAACRSIGDFKAASSLQSWLLGIARHKIEDYYRAKMRAAEVDEQDTPTLDFLELDARLDRGRREKRVLAVLERLPERYRFLLQWRYWDHRKTEEIAEALERTPKAVERMLSRAREQFRREWEALS